MTSDDELLERMDRGDDAALEELLGEHLPGLRGFVRLHAGRALRAREESSDLVQSVCREILQHRERFQYPGKEGFRRWLYTTAMRKIANRAEYWRARKREAAREVPLQQSASDGNQLLACYRSFGTPSGEIAAAEEVTRIETAFDELPEHYREVILLSKIAGLSHAEVAEQTGRTEGAVSMLLFRALAKLAELLDIDR